MFSEKVLGFWLGVLGWKVDCRVRVLIFLWRPDAESCVKYAVFPLWRRSIIYHIYSARCSVLTVSLSAGVCSPKRVLGFWLEVLGWEVVIHVRVLVFLWRSIVRVICSL